MDVITEALIEHAEADRKFSCPDCAQWSWHGPDAERKVIEHYLKVHAAPPAPVAHGVAELLAECARRQTHIAYCPWSGSVAHISCDEIVRLLTPGGAAGTEAETVTEWQVWIDGRDEPLVTNKWRWVTVWNNHSPGAIVRLCRREVSTRTTPWEDVPLPERTTGSDDGGNG
jgi:hypothetical protein